MANYKIIITGLLVILFMAGCTIIGPAATEEENPINIKIDENEEIGKITLTITTSEGKEIVQERPIVLTDKSLSEIIAEQELKDKLAFDSMTYDEKVNTINKGYFYSCSIVSGFCMANPDLDGCVKYCQGRYSRTAATKTSWIMVSITILALLYIYLTRKKK